MASQRRSARDVWIFILGFIISLAIGYGIILGFYQPEIFRLQDEIRAKSEVCEPGALMFYLADSSLHFIRQNHPEVAASIPKDIYWQGGRTTPEGLMGHETYVYRGDGWTVTIEWNVVALTNLRYTVTAEHDSLIWKGEIERGEITEISFEQ